MIQLFMDSKHQLISSWIITLYCEQVQDHLISCILRLIYYPIYLLRPFQRNSHAYNDSFLSGRGNWRAREKQPKLLILCTSFHYRKIMEPDSSDTLELTLQFLYSRKKKVFSFRWAYVLWIICILIYRQWPCIYVHIGVKSTNANQLLISRSLYHDKNTYKNVTERSVFLPCVTVMVRLVMHQSLSN